MGFCFGLVGFVGLVRLVGQIVGLCGIGHDIAGEG